MKREETYSLALSKDENHVLMSPISPPFGTIFIHFAVTIVLVLLSIPIPEEGIRMV
jgi:hypothetical protein